MRKLAMVTAVSIFTLLLNNPGQLFVRGSASSIQTADLSKCIDIYRVLYGVLQQKISWKETHRDGTVSDAEYNLKITGQSIPTFVYSMDFSNGNEILADQHTISFPNVDTSALVVTSFLSSDSVVRSSIPVWAVELKSLPGKKAFLDAADDDHAERFLFSEKRLADRLVQALKSLSSCKDEAEKIPEIAREILNTSEAENGTTQLTEGLYNIISKDTGKCLDIDGGYDMYRVAWVKTYHCHGLSQVWWLRKASPGVYQIKSYIR